MFLSAARSVPRRALRGAAVLGALVVAQPLAAQCAIAPSHGTYCKYKDPKLFKDLIAIAKVEGARLAGLKLHESELEKLDRLTKRGQDAVSEYDSLLRAVRTPRAPVPATFAAVFNVLNPDARVRLGAWGGTVVEVDVAQEAANAINRAGTARDPDALLLRARALGVFATKLSVYGQTQNIAGQLGRVYAEMDSVSRRSDSLARQSTEAARRVRGKWQGLDGESDAQKIEAKVRLDGLRATQELMHADNLERTVTALQRAQAARAMRLRMLTQHNSYQGAGW